MVLLRSFHYHLSGQPDVRPVSAMTIPMVYEDVTPSPTSWEYRVLTIDVREEALPDTTRLNDLGKLGWLLISVLDQRTQATSSLVHYYFVRQKME